MICANLPKMGLALLAKASIRTAVRQHQTSLHCRNARYNALQYYTYT